MDPHRQEGFLDKVFAFVGTQAGVQRDDEVPDDRAERNVEVRERLSVAGPSAQEQLRVVVKPLVLVHGKPLSPPAAVATEESAQIARCEAHVDPGQYPHQRQMNVTLHGSG